MFFAAVCISGSFGPARGTLLPGAKHNAKEGCYGRQLNVEVVKRSLKHFGVLVDERRVDGLLASPKAKRGQKTARVLRNGLVHRWDASDAAEAVERFDELVTAMMALVDAIAMRVRGQTP